MYVKRTGDVVGTCKEDYSEVVHPRRRNGGNCVGHLRSEEGVELISYRCSIVEQFIKYIETEEPTEYLVFHFLEDFNARFTKEPSLGNQFFNITISLFYFTFTSKHQQSLYAIICLTLHISVDICDRWCLAISNVPHFGAEAFVPDSLSAWALLFKEYVSFRYRTE